MEMIKIICVVRGGLLEDVFSNVDSSQVDVELLDYDNMKACDLESERGKAEYEGYEELEREIEGMHSVF